MEQTIEGVSKAVRYALESNARTARLAMLIFFAIIAWRLML